MFEFRRKIIDFGVLFAALTFGVWTLDVLREGNVLSLQEWHQPPPPTPFETMEGGRDSLPGTSGSEIVFPIQS